MIAASALMNLSPGFYVISMHENRKVGILPLTKDELNKLIDLMGEPE